MKVILARRHHGEHVPVKEAVVPGPFSRYCRRGKDSSGADAPTVDEDRLLSKLPEGFLPEPPKKILLVVGDAGGRGGTAVAYPRLFRVWGKYFDAYSLTCEASRSPTYEAWKKRAADYAEKHLQTGDLFDDGDPYDLVADLDPFMAYEAGEKPSAYVRRVFEEDFAMAANDRELARGR